MEQQCSHWLTCWRGRGCCRVCLSRALCRGCTTTARQAVSHAVPEIRFRLWLMSLPSSFKTRNIVLLLVQTWLVGIVYYGGSKESSAFTRAQVSDMSVLQYTSHRYICRTVEATRQSSPRQCYSAWWWYKFLVPWCQATWLNGLVGRGHPSLQASFY